MELVFRSALWGALAFAPFAVLASDAGAEFFSQHSAVWNAGPAAASVLGQRSLRGRMRAITDGRWPDAEAIFTKVASATR